jgi:hypothetical protein
LQAFIIVINSDQALALSFFTILSLTLFNLIPLFKVFQMTTNLVVTPGPMSLAVDVEIESTDTAVK